MVLDALGMKKPDSHSALIARISQDHIHHEDTKYTKNSRKPFWLITLKALDFLCAFVSLWFNICFSFSEFVVEKGLIIRRYLAGTHLPPLAT